MSFKLNIEAVSYIMNVVLVVVLFAIFSQYKSNYLDLNDYAKCVIDETRKSNPSSPFDKSTERKCGW